MQAEQFACMPYVMHSCMAPYKQLHIHNFCIPRSITVTTIPFSPDRLFMDRASSVSWVRLPSSAGMDPDKTDSHAGHAKGYAMLCYAKE